MRRYNLVVLAIAIVLLSACRSGAESLPFRRLDDLRGPYDGVGKSGDAFYMLPIGKVRNWMINAYWSSAHTRSSPVLGYGWCIPALESRFVHVGGANDRRWIFHQPDGYVRVFILKKSDGGKKFLSGGDSWSAEIDGDRATVVADPKDGKPPSKFHFQSGRLVRMEAEEGKFEIKYVNRQAESIVSGNKTLLGIVRVAKPSAHTVFQFENGRRVALFCREFSVFTELDEYLECQIEKKRCLAEARVNGGKFAEFSYGAGSGVAEFVVNGEKWTWDAKTRYVKAHGDWTYEIKPPLKDGDEPAYARTHRDGRSESCHNERSSGKYRRVYPDGSIYERQVFTSGPLAYRRTKWSMFTNPDGTVRSTVFTYDGKGRLYHRRNTSDEPGKEMQEDLMFDAGGKIIRRRVDGKEVPLK